ncbi:tryptophan synthase beta subunit-like PLP-dependent enzyme [Gloeophyllum trabeum ATCC 11539]|uniref:Tryptophan synthase beta subunit-like PLP-dependent enzyme n=1 Tax=Gloeophyllum trabeum (strain ATCC 11539 / FP-39264 / Madison 617) TaxID=670483 RepID=S7RD67_GLOTA|nr:tryptophan synthase beta subunit-like PLP-dependent enzyme [Gloeophyllum trabeum ATCC 11539]EPQ52155.1 tryptophan synthase beta subunit-like PLP-dependent enzyme [Gloeophyllum trabeum ATCC 11539]
MTKTVHPGPRQANGVEEMTIIWDNDIHWMQGSTCSLWSVAHNKVACYECLVEPSPIHLTPLLTSVSLSALAPADTDILFKAENLQKGGAFKIRGATYAVSKLSPAELEKGVITHSSGNHAQALAIAAKANNVKAYIVMPETSAVIKKNATKGYGAEVILSPPLAEDRERVCEEVRQRTGAFFIPPYDHYDIITGQGTVALEMIRQAREMGKPLGALVVQVGGGGLLAGCSIVAKAHNIPIYAAEPELADDCYRGFQSGTRVERVVTSTVADGLRTPVGIRNFKIIKKNVEGVITVSEREIVTAQKLVWERMKMVIEPSAAVGVAVVLFSEKWRSLGISGNVGVVWSGGNVDLDAPMPWTAVRE